MEDFRILDPDPYNNSTGSASLHLTGTELTDLKELAQLADRLWQCNPSQLVAAVAAELQSDEESEVDIPSTVKPAKEAEKVQEVGVQEASHVYVRVGAVTGPLDATSRGPYRMLLKERKKMLLEVGATQQWVSIDRLKPHTAAATPAVAQPPPRGRPSKS